MKPYLLVLLCGLLTTTAPARADDDAEREALAKIVYEIERVQQMAADAQKDVTSAPRVKFRYDWLLRDLQMVRDGIESHLDSPHQPRSVPPLKGDYRQ
ncbi:MAG: RAQPRD family integrative conjugative element protein [Herminiimonas sp.]|nr:RAQPRD family integrative conjugative element protein [Herminiimonas sp.]